MKIYEDWRMINDVKFHEFCLHENFTEILPETFLDNFMESW